MVQRVAVSHGVSAAFLVNLASGGLAYWPGDWCGVDVKHFLSFFLFAVCCFDSSNTNANKKMRQYLDKENPPLGGS